ncbi:MAG: DUF4838 domain-containing protein [Lentisphaeria bacterium]|nr:DUF4838 domain-containing protein [Lentisphaeria bacterium]
MMRKKLSVFAGILLAAMTLFSAEFKLTDGGRAASCIVLRENASKTEKHAAKELSYFLGKISGGECPRIGTAPVAGKYPIYLELTDDKRVEKEGFRITADAKSLRIAGREEVGVLYGVYEVLKKDGGIRWLTPGDDGEYFKVKPTISVKEGVRIKNPDFAWRNLHFVSMRYSSPIKDTRDWGMRNNARFRARLNLFETKELKDLLEERAVIPEAGGHCFTPLLLGDGTGKRVKAETLFREHPEYFPVVNGKRTISRGGGAGNAQPCTSNADVIRIVADGVAAWSRKAAGKPLLFGFGNNDCTQWCSCEKCLAQDPPEERKKGIKSTRYWKFLNAVLEQVRAKAPNAKMVGWTYQTFSVPPKGVKPNLNLTALMISNHRRCWKHALDDPNCPTNGWYLKYNKDWHDTGVKMYSYEMLSRAGIHFIPIERIWVENLRWYKKNMPNFIGMQTERSAPDGIYTRSKAQQKEGSIAWFRMWQSIYLAMYFHWDVNADFEKVAEEANSLYYGKGWEGGIKPFRKLLEKLFLESSGCWGYGHSAPVGKFLDVPGAKEKLEKYLSSAEKAAALDPDKRALAHVKREREFFESTWVKAHEEYIKNFREIKAYPLAGKIVLDGKLSEKDWKNADTVTRFTLTNGSGLAKCQTAVKIAYDEDYIYLGIECLEPHPDKLLTEVKEHDGPVWGDNNIEIFLNDPILGGAYFHIMVNTLGTVCDGSVTPGQKGIQKSYESLLECRTSFEKDRYFMEMRIPAKTVTGSKLVPGSVLKMNIMRGRRLAGERGEKELSTWSKGTPHSVEVFHAVNFAHPRKVGSGNRQEIDTRAWKNGTFNELAPAKKRKIPKTWKVKDDLIPLHFSLSNGKSYGGELEMLLHPGSTDNYFLRLSKGFLSQSHDLKAVKFKAVFRVRGKGKISFGVLRRSKDWKYLGMKTVAAMDVDEKDWAYKSIEFDHPTGDLTERHGFLFWVREGRLDIDDLFLAGKQ